MKNSDRFSSLVKFANKVGKYIATTAFFMVAAITMAFAQDLTIIEGSVYGFKVDNHPGNTFEWTVVDESFNAMDPLSFSMLEGQFETDVKLRFNDMNRAVGQLVFLVVTESNPHGCSTKRALKILVEPNNMYLEFAANTSQECYGMGDYLAPLKVGFNFKDKGSNTPIPESRFPLTLKYTVENKTTAPGVIIQGNSGNDVTLAYDATNNYFLPVTETAGQVAQTTDYELTITSVKDKYDTEITKNQDDIRIQIRVTNHLPQNLNMNMAMAMVTTSSNITYSGQIK